MELKKKRILEISKKLGLSHIGSCLSVLPILEEIYSKKRLQDKVILDNAHAHLAHLVVMDSYRQISVIEATDIEHIEHIIKDYGIHCDRKAECDATGGSLGHGIGIGIGYAIANPDIKVYVIVSDGGMMEGSNWEALRLIHDLNIKNIIIYTNFNGSTALRDLTEDQLFELKDRMERFCGDKIAFRETDNGGGFEGVQGHYKIL